MPAFVRYGDLFIQSTRAQSVLLLTSDFSITAAIVTGLWKSRTGFQKTDSLVMRLVFAVIESMIAPLILGVAYIVSCDNGREELTLDVDRRRKRSQLMASSRR